MKKTDGTNGRNTFGTSDNDTSEFDANEMNVSDDESDPSFQYDDESESG